MGDWLEEFTGAVVVGVAQVSSVDVDTRLGVINYPLGNVQNEAGKGFFASLIDLILDPHISVQIGEKRINLT